MAEAKITKWYGAQVLTAATASNRAAVLKAALELEKYVKTHYTVVGPNDLSRGDRVSVRKTKTGKRHYRSLPGEPPAVESGDLRVRTSHDIIETPMHIDGFVGVTTAVDYGLYLELGTSKMQPRPFLRPALAAMHKRIMQLLREANR